MQLHLVSSSEVTGLLQVDEDEAGGLRALADVLMSYGERHFEGSANQRRLGMWANVLLMCGQFERVRSLIIHAYNMADKC